MSVQRTFTVWMKYRYRWSPDWLVLIQLFQYVQITTYFLVWSTPIQIVDQLESDPSTDSEYSQGLWLLSFNSSNYSFCGENWYFRLICCLQRSLCNENQFANQYYKNELVHVHCFEWNKVSCYQRTLVNVNQTLWTDVLIFAKTGVTSISIWALDQSTCNSRRPF